MFVPACVGAAHVYNTKAHFEIVHQQLVHGRIGIEIEQIESTMFYFDAPIGHLYAECGESLVTLVLNALGFFQPGVVGK
jgi:hypothetical protein